jgi:hypothetical protein
MDNRLEKLFQKQSKKTKFSNEEINQLEIFFSVKLPKEYKAFLSNFGSVVIEAGYPDSFIVEYKDEKRIEDILNFLSQKEILEAYNTLREINEYEGEAQIPQYFIPIAHTNVSDLRNYILLHKKDHSIWLTQEDESLASDKDSFGFIANNFSEFLDKIDEYDRFYSFHSSSCGMHIRLQITKQTSCNP